MSVVRNIISTTASDVTMNLANIGVQLDGSEASLQTLDEAIAMIWGDQRPPDDVFDGMVWGYGCYVAALVERLHAGEWQPSDDIGYDFVLTATAAAINPWVWVEKRFLLGEPLAAAYGRFQDAGVVG